MSLLSDPARALSEYVSHASVSADPTFASGVASAREFAVARLKELGFAVEIVETPIHPVVLGTRGDPSWPHLIIYGCLLYTSPSPRDKRQSRMPSSA